MEAGRKFVEWGVSEEEEGANVIAIFGGQGQDRTTTERTGRLIREASATKRTRTAGGLLH